MSGEIKITIPLTYNDLQGAAAWLGKIADIYVDTPTVETQSVSESAAPVQVSNLPVELPPVSLPPAPPEAPTPTAPATPPDVDASGLRWDARIHSESKALLKSGLWRQRRNTDPALITAVEAELRGTPVAAPAPVTAPPVAPVTPAPDAAPAAPAPDAAPAAPAAALPLPTMTTYLPLMQKLASAGIPSTVITECVQRHGLKTIGDLATRPDLVPAVAAELLPEG